MKKTVYRFFGFFTVIIALSLLSLVFLHTVPQNFIIVAVVLAFFLLGILHLGYGFDKIEINKWSDRSLKLLISGLITEIGGLLIMYSSIFFFFRYSSSFRPLFLYIYIFYPVGLFLIGISLIFLIVPIFKKNSL